MAGFILVAPIGPKPMRPGWAPSSWNEWAASSVKFDHPAHHILLAEYRHAIQDAEARLKRLTQQVAEMSALWSMAPVVKAYQAMRGISFMAAVILATEIGDLKRFDNPAKLMAFLGLVPSERSTGETVTRGGITKTGNDRARRTLIEGAWTYRFPARLSQSLDERQTDIPQTVRDIAWKAQVRLCGRYRKLIAAGKLKTIVVTAVAREMAAFLWAIGQEVEPLSPSS